MNKNIIDTIQKEEFLKRAFWFQSNDPDDFDDMFENEAQKKQFSHIDWLYWSDHPYATLIGIMENGSIFAIDDEFEQNVLTDYFFNIPFIFTKLIIKDYSNPKKALLENELYKSNLADLIKYTKWCKENNIKIDDQYLDILKP